jgi:hypothetical protein
MRENQSAADEKEFVKKRQHLRIKFYEPGFLGRDVMGWRRAWAEEFS